jgi:hypothetical protein
MVTVKELSSRLKMHPASVRRLCRDCKIPATKRGQWKISLQLPKGTLVTAPRLAAFLGKSLDTIYTMIKKSKSLSAVKVNGRWYIAKDEWIKLLQIRM